MELNKLNLASFRETGTDEELENPEENWRELLFDHSLLHTAWYTHKRGGTWENWDKDTIVRYHAAVVDALRSLKFPMRESNES